MTMQNTDARIAEVVAIIRAENRVTDTLGEALDLIVSLRWGEYEGDDKLDMAQLLCDLASRYQTECEEDAFLSDHPATEYDT